MNDETPDGLHRMQYATHILEEVLGWPSKGNSELLADCLLSISKSRKISIKQAHGYMVRAIKLAREQGIEIDGHWFRNGEYTKMRPQTEFKGTYEPISKEEQARVEAWKKSPEYQAFLRESTERIEKAFAGRK